MSGALPPLKLHSLKVDSNPVEMPLLSPGPGQPGPALGRPHFSRQNIPSVSKLSPRVTGPAGRVKGQSQLIQERLVESCPSSPGPTAPGPLYRSTKHSRATSPVGKYKKMNLPNSRAPTKSPQGNVRSSRVAGALITQEYEQENTGCKSLPGSPSRGRGRPECHFKLREISLELLQECKNPSNDSDVDVDEELNGPKTHRSAPSSPRSEVARLEKIQPDYVETTKKQLKESSLNVKQVNK